MFLIRPCFLFLSLAFYNFFFGWNLGIRKAITSQNLCILALFRGRPSLISLAGGFRTSQTISDFFLLLASDCGTAALTHYTLLFSAAAKLLKLGETENSQAAPRQARMLDSLSSPSFLSQGRGLGVEDLLCFPLLCCVGEGARKAHQTPQNYLPFCWNPFRFYKSLGGIVSSLISRVLREFSLSLLSTWCLCRDRRTRSSSLPSD